MKSVELTTKPKESFSDEGSLAASNGKIFQVFIEFLIVSFEFS